MNKLWESHCLDGAWELFAAPNKACAAVADQYRTLGALAASDLLHVAGTVPGNFELDFQQAGILSDLFVGTHSLKAQELENLHLWYARSFNFAQDSTEAWHFCFEGIDTFAEIYLNGVLIGESDNMLIPHEFAATGLKQGRNELVVHILPVFLKARENTFEAGVTTLQSFQGDALTVRKAPHMFGWDIMPRMLSGGLWRSVYLFKKPQERIESVYMSTVAASPSLATFHVYFRLHITGDSVREYCLRFDGTCGDSRFSVQYPLWHTEGRTLIHVENPKLWWPKGMGEPNLYDVHIALCHGDTVLDEQTFVAGMRKVELIKTDTADENSGEFCFLVNGHRMFVRGLNWVPLDPFHSRDGERLPRALALLGDSNCNMVRCWGGNVYESDAFFDYCDRNGIAVWQDFAMACSYYPQDRRFQAVIEREAEVVVRRLRNHPALFIWVGDNECDIAITGWHPVRLDPNENVLTRQVLPEVVRRMDPFRPYLPSSPYISKVAFDQGKDRMLPELHLWGPRGYYKADFYSKTVCHFASEIGYHGCPSPQSVKQFITPDKLWPWNNNEEWRVHATCMELAENTAYANRIPVMDNQIYCLFGCHPENLEAFALASQLTQAEANKFFVEKFRLGKWTKSSGILIWNLIDGWPQFSDSIVDYYFNRKLAYAVLKRCQEPVCLMFREPADGVLTLACANDTLEQAAVTYRVTDVTNGRVLLEGQAVVEENITADVDALTDVGEETVFYLIEWEYNGHTYKNHYLSGVAPVSLERCLEGYRKSGLLDIEGF